MTSQLQKIFHSLNALTQLGRWWFEELVNQRSIFKVQRKSATIRVEGLDRQNVTIRFEDLDRSALQHTQKLSPQEIFASTQGSWSYQNCDEIDAQLASQRQLDWDE